MDLIFIHGPPAAGKLTVGKALAAMTGYPLFHNHLIVDAVGAVFPFGSEPFVRLRQQFWLDVFEAAGLAARPLIFTFAPEATAPADFVELACRRVSQAGGRIRFVALQVSDTAHEQRVVAADRARFNKLRSVEILRRLRAAQPATDLPADLTIDTDKVSPEAAARRIVAAFNLQRLPVPRSQYG